MDDDPVEQRQRHHDADAGSLRDDRGRQCAKLIGKPFIGGMQGHRIGRSLAGAESNPAGDHRGEPDRPEHRKLGQRPDEAHDQQRPACLHSIDDEAGNDRRNRKQQEETRADQSELAWAELQLLHDRHGGDPDHRLVGKVDQHEQEQQRDDQPSFPRRFRGVGGWRPRRRRRAVSRISTAVDREAWTLMGNSVQALGTCPYLQIRVRGGTKARDFRP